MDRKEYMLTRDLDNWVFYAKYDLGMEEIDAILLWNNTNNVGKKLICECREEMDKPMTRLFIRDVTHVVEDTFKKDGWWNTFTLSKDKVKKGMYLAEVLSYRLDRNDYLNCEVKIIMPVDDVEARELFSNKKRIFNISAWWLMMAVSGEFLREYDFSSHEIIHEPNFKALKERFPTFNNLKSEEIATKALNMYIKGEITTKEIEECLDTPSDWEKLIKDIVRAVQRGNTKEKYGQLYPLFANKVTNNIENGDSYFDEYNAEDYIKRQMDYYYQLLKDGKVESIEKDAFDDFESYTLSIVESALKYRKSLKDAEKAERKKKRKNNN